MSVKIPSWKLVVLIFIPLVYILAGLLFIVLIKADVIEKLPARPLDLVEKDSLREGEAPDIAAAEAFVREKLKQENGHINLYYPAQSSESRRTNSEAASYYLLWNAVERNKREFDLQLDFLKENMIHPTGGYLMWRLEGDDKPITDGSNIATDADLRTIKALLIAEKQWDDEKYTEHIDSLAEALENIAITNDGLFSPYGGVRETGELWKTQEVWLSYSDFEVFRELSYRRGEPWKGVYDNTKKKILQSQLPIGFYNAKLDEQRNFLNFDEVNGQKRYSINSLWVMVRAAESRDKELQASAHKALDFYKSEYAEKAMIDSVYDSDGNGLSGGDSAWVYALVGRAAVALDEENFSAEMMKKLKEKQILNESSELYGAFPEGNNVAGQFTTQESILTVQDYLRS